MTASSRLRSRLISAALAGALILTAGGCGRAKDDSVAQKPKDVPQIGVKGAQGSQRDAAADLGFPVFATKNTLRVAGADAVADAAAVTQAVFPGGDTGPEAVALVDVGDWRTAVAAAALNADPLGAPSLFVRGDKIPAATATALTTLAPKGSKAAGGAQVIRVGTRARPALQKTTDITGENPFQLARRIDAFVSSARGSVGDEVLLVAADAPAFAAPAAAYAAKSGVPVLFTNKDAAPRDTLEAIKTHDQPTIYVLGPSAVISPKVSRQLKNLGKVVRVGGPDPVANSVEFARFSQDGFGWGIVDPGHGMVFLPQAADPTIAAAAAPLSASGAYGPALLLSSPAALDGSMRAFLLDIQPGYMKDPVRGVYNRAWLVGDTRAITPALQASIDRFLEITSIAEREKR